MLTRTGSGSSSAATVAGPLRPPRAAAPDLHSVPTAHNLEADAPLRSARTVWDLAGGELLASILIDPQERVKAVAFANEDRWLLATTTNGPLVIHSMVTTNVLEATRDRIYRGFSDDECGRYFEINACPTLDELRRG